MASRRSANFLSRSSFVSSLRCVVMLWASIGATLLSDCSSGSKTSGCTLANCAVMNASCHLDLQGNGFQFCSSTVGRLHPDAGIPTEPYAGCVQACIKDGLGDLVECLASQTEPDAGPACAAATDSCAPAAGQPPQASCASACGTAADNCTSVCSNASWDPCMECASSCFAAQMNCLSACPTVP